MFLCCCTIHCECCVVDALAVSYCVSVCVFACVFLVSSFTLSLHTVHRLLLPSHHTLLCVVTRLIWICSDNICTHCARLCWQSRLLPHSGRCLVFFFLFVFRSFDYYYYSVSILSNMTCVWWLSCVCVCDVLMCLASAAVVCTCRFACCYCVVHSNAASAQLLLSCGGV